MVLSVLPAPRARARSARSTSSDRRTGGRVRTACLLARTSLLVLAGRAAVSPACGCHGRHRVEHGHEVGRRLDVVLAGPTDAPSRQRCLLVIGRAGDLGDGADGAAPAASSAAREAVPVDAGTASTRTDDAPVHRQASPTVLAEKGSAAVGRHTRSLDRPLQRGGRSPVGARRAGSAAATHVMSSLLVAGLIGLLGVRGPAASIVHSVTGPVRRAARVLQAPGTDRRGHRLRPTTLHEFHDTSRAVATAGDDLVEAGRGIGADARTHTTASEEPTATSGPLSSGAERFPTSAGAVTITANAIQQTRPVAVDATMASARSGGAGIGSAVTAPGCGRPAEEVATATGAVTAASTPTTSSVATTRYAAARSRALGPTTALWHAVSLDRLVGAIGGACETTVCGSLVRVSTEQRWPVPARDVCPACSTLAH